MKKFVLYAVIVCLCVAALAGCSKTATTPTPDPAASTPTPVASTPIDAKKVVEDTYAELKAAYPDVDPVIEMVEDIVDDYFPGLPAVDVVGRYITWPELSGPETYIIVAQVKNQADIASVQGIFETFKAAVVERHDDPVYTFPQFDTAKYTKIGVKGDVVYLVMVHNADIPTMKVMTDKAEQILLTKLA